MKNILLLATLITIVVLAVPILLRTQVPSNDLQILTPSPISSAQTPDQKVDIKAFFTIITDSIARSFSNPKYHNRSSTVYIQADDPSIVHVKKQRVTWQNFFDTLPMKLTRDCLTSGDGETYCSGKAGQLKFFLNNIETPDLLDREILEGDSILIKFM